MFINDTVNCNDNTEYPIFDTSLHYNYVKCHKNVFCNRIESDYEFETMICCRFCIIEFWINDGGNDSN